MTTTKRLLLTKSRFKIGCECPTKLFYTDRPTEYANAKLDDAFLKALAEGGFQVGAMAQLFYPGGTEVTERDYESSVTKTSELLKSDRCTIFEAAVRFEDLFIRLDVLNKTSPTTIQIIEVKAKTIDTNDEINFFTKRGARRIRSEWEPYLLDIAFQTYVVRKAFPNMKTESYVMLADKSQVATIDGLNQMFKIESDPKDGRIGVSVQPHAKKDDVLTRINVDDPVDFILNQMYGSMAGWEARIHELAGLVTKGERKSPALSGACKHCEFRVASTDLKGSQKSGFLECWSEAAKISAADYGTRSLVFDIGNFRGSDKAIASGRHYADQRNEGDFSNREGSKSGLSNSERQRQQVDYAKAKTLGTQLPGVYFDRDSLVSEMTEWKFPLHFIDFETTNGGPSVS